MAEKVRVIDTGTLLKANRNRIDQIRKEDLYLEYDATLDTLFVEFGGPKGALSEHVVDNVMVRIDAETLNIVGLEILDFFSDFLPNNRLVREMLQDLGLDEGKDCHINLSKTRFKGFQDWLAGLIPLLAQAAGGRT